MKVLKASVSNFGSYETLDIDFHIQHLTLISGPTGSGKSTICDIIPWVLFGRTAKDGVADEIRSWNTEGTTSGIVYIQYFAEVIQVVRTRKPNDLYMIIGGDIARGKDLQDTQRLINETFGVTYEAYLSGAYFHEFSQTASFFITTAKNRRLILEQVVDLSMPKRLTERLKVKLKELDGGIEGDSEKCHTARIKLMEAEKQYQTELTRAEAWDTTHKKRFDELVVKSNNFESDKTSRLNELNTKALLKKLRLETELLDLCNSPILTQDFETEIERLNTEIEGLGDDKCSTCGAAKSNTKRLQLNKRQYELQRQNQEKDLLKVQITATRDRLETQREATEQAVKSEQAKQNPYLEQLASLKSETNKHTQYAKIAKVNIETLTIEVEALQAKIDANLELASDYELLQDVIEDFRALLVKNTVMQLEEITNRRLNDYFNAEIRVQFETADKDRIEIQIYKDGNLCSYSQLSKGQRGMLKLCFGTAVMKTVQEHNSVTFNAVFLDEALDGLDDRLKVQSFGLLQELAQDHDSVFVVEHNESLKALFINKLEVSLSNGRSEVS